MIEAYISLHWGHVLLWIIAFGLTVSFSDAAFDWLFSRWGR